MFFQMKYDLNMINGAVFLYIFSSYSVYQYFFIIISRSWFILFYA